MRARDFVFEQKKIVSEGPVADANMARAENLIKWSEQE